MKMPKNSRTDLRESTRLKNDPNRPRQLDEAARQRRQRKQLEALEADNFGEDPHADLSMHKKAPKFDERFAGDQEKGKKKRKSRLGEYFKFKFKRNFNALIEEETSSATPAPNYLTAAVPASKIPERKFCAVCGHFSNYTCTSCGARFCCVRCLGTHKDTRCLKWTA